MKSFVETFNMASSQQLCGLHHSVLPKRAQSVITGCLRHGPSYFFYHYEITFEQFNCRNRHLSTYVFFGRISKGILQHSLNEIICGDSDSDMEGVGILF